MNRQTTYETQTKIKSLSFLVQILHSHLQLLYLVECSLIARSSLNTLRVLYNINSILNVVIEDNTPSLDLKSFYTY